MSTIMYTTPIVNGGTTLYVTPAAGIAVPIAQITVELLMPTVTIQEYSQYNIQANTTVLNTSVNALFLGPGL